MHNTTVHTNSTDSLAMALLCRAQMYCLYMADRQRGTQSDDRRRAYNAAAVLLREARERIGQ